MGENFGSDLSESEVRYLMREEWARTAQDVLWRRTKRGLVIQDKADIARLENFMAEQLPAVLTD